MGKYSGQVQWPIPDGQVQCGQKTGHLKHKSVLNPTRAFKYNKVNKVRAIKCSFYRKMEIEN